MRPNLRTFAAPALIAAVVLLFAASPVTGLGSLDIEVEGGDRLFDVDEMYPGSSATSFVSVTNNSTEQVMIGLRVTNVVSDDNGCSTPEARVDDTCGAGEGELGEQVVLTIEHETTGGSSETVVDRVLLATLADHTIIDDDLGTSSTSRYKFTLELPVESGNETQSDSVEFAVEFMSQMATVAQLPPTDAPRTGGAVVTEVGARLAAAPLLPRTGSDADTMIGAASLALLIGALLVVGTRTRRRGRQAAGHHPDQTLARTQ